jgi:hypothetical protein
MVETSRLIYSGLLLFWNKKAHIHWISFGYPQGYPDIGFRNVLRPGFFSIDNLHHHVQFSINKSTGLKEIKLLPNFVGV